MASNLVEHLSRILDMSAVLGPMAWWFIRWSRRLETTTILTKQLYSKDGHLPHIYGRLRVHDEALKIPTPEHPPIGVAISNGITGGESR